jgi:hypothetical protein
MHDDTGDTGHALLARASAPVARHLLNPVYHSARGTHSMQSDHIKIADDSTTEVAAFGTFTTSASDTATAPEPTPIGLLTLGIAWLFGLEALLIDERRARRR